MKNNIKISLIIIILLIIIVAVIIVLNNNKSKELSNADTSKYPEIITELERLYGKEGNFKVIGTKGGEIDQRDYKAYAYFEGARTDDWQGKYFEDAFLLISTDYLENPFYVGNNFVSLQYNFEKALLEEGKEPITEKREATADAQTQYVVTTDKKFRTMQNDGGSHYNEYYEIDFQSNIVKKCEDNYKGFEGYIYEGKIIYTKTLSKQESLDLKNLLDEVLDEGETYEYSKHKDYKYYTITNEEYSDITMGDSKDIEKFLNLVKE